MKKQGYAILMAFILVFALTGCGNKSLLSAKEPVELTMWHVYGEQAGSPMDTLVEEFNRREGEGRPRQGDGAEQRREDRRLSVRDTEGFRAGDAGPLHLPHRRRHRPGRG